MTAKWFADRARELGLQFREPEALQIYSVSDKPQHAGASGRARPVRMVDATLLADWLTAFQGLVPQMGDEVPAGPIDLHRRHRSVGHGELVRTGPSGNRSAAGHKNGHSAVNRMSSQSSDEGVCRRSGRSRDRLVPLTWLLCHNHNDHRRLTQCRWLSRRLDSPELG
jgi:hypothetical protein